MPIKKPSELDFSNKKVNMLLLGRPGYGKSSLAASAPRPLHIDWENGVDRVESCYRKDTLSIDSSQLVDDKGNKLDKNRANAKKYELMIEELKSNSLDEYDTLINDSVGKILEILSSVVILENSVNAQKDGVTLSLKGYGALATKFKNYTEFIYSLHKHVIWIAHVTEINDGEVIKTRVNIPGSTKDSIWNDVDLGGYLDMNGKKRTLSFTPTDRYDAKGTHGIKGTYEIPILKTPENGGKESDNHFLTDLFNVYIDDIKSSQKKYSEDSVVYKEAMEIVPRIKAISNVAELNEIVEEIKNVKHALTSKDEIASFFKEKVAELGALYDKEKRIYYIDANEKE